VVEPAAPKPQSSDLLAAMPIAMIMLDASGHIQFANGEAERLLNQSERSMLGQLIGNILTLPADYKIGREGRGFAEFDAQIDTARAGRIRADFSETFIADYPGWRLITLHGAGMSRRMGQSDRAAARAAVGAAAMLAHEIKNPLSGIRGAAQLLGHGADDIEGAAELTTLIVTEVDRIAALIDRMQDFTDTRPLKLAAHNIYPLLDHARRVALAGFARGIAIEERFDPSLPHAVVDRDALLQVLLNLIKNACEAISLQAERRITLTAAYRHGMSSSHKPDKPRQPLPIELCVIDNGPGAPADISEHLFDPFVSGKPEGQGLGLALVEKLVRDMGGIVQYAREGQPELTVLRVLLPRGPA